MQICKSFGTIELPVKYEKNSTRTNPEFGQTQGEIFEKASKKYISIQGGMKLRKPSILVINGVSSCLSFFPSASTTATYIFTAFNCTTTIISLEPRALTAELQQFTLSCTIS
jgi:hypothetical protein